MHIFKLTATREDLELTLSHPEVPLSVGNNNLVICWTRFADKYIGELFLESETPVRPERDRIVRAFRSLPIKVFQMEFPADENGNMPEQAEGFLTENPDPLAQIINQSSDIPQLAEGVASVLEQVFNIEYEPIQKASFTSR